MEKIIKIGCALLKKAGKVLVIMCGILLLLFLVIRVGWKIASYDAYWSDFTKEMKKEFPVIKKIETIHIGPEQYIDIYSDEHVTLEELEKMLVYIMRDIEEGEFVECLDRVAKKAIKGGEIVYLIIRNTNGHIGDSFPYSFIASRSERYQVWTLREHGSLTDIQYRVKDYIK